MTKYALIYLFLATNGLQAFEYNFECFLTTIRMGNQEKNFTERQAIAEDGILKIKVNDYKAYTDFNGDKHELKYTKTLKNGADVYSWENSDQKFILLDNNIAMGNNKLTMTTYKVLPNWAKEYMSEKEMTMKMNCKAVK